MTKEILNCLEKTPELKDRLTMLIMVGRSADRHCFGGEVGIGSRSQKCWMTEIHACKISFSVAGLKKLVGI